MAAPDVISQLAQVAKFGAKINFDFIRLPRGRPYLIRRFGGTVCENAVLYAIRKFWCCCIYESLFYLTE
jgi:hypothetical protein